MPEGFAFVEGFREGALEFFLGDIEAEAAFLRFSAFNVEMIYGGRHS